jgi:Phospholipase_D-nuclease N-terminal
VTLAQNPDYPLLDLFWTMLMIFGLGLFLYTLIVVFRDLFGRADLSAWGKTAWVLFVLVLPLVGSLTYLITQSAAMGERALRSDGAGRLRLDAHTRSVTGNGGYRDIHETVTAREAMIGPMRPS